MNVVLGVDPYSHEAMAVLNEVESTMNNELQRLERGETITTSPVLQV